MWARVCHTMCVEITVRASYFPPPCGCQGSHSGIRVGSKCLYPLINLTSTKHTLTYGKIHIQLFWRGLILENKHSYTNTNN